MEAAAVLVNALRRKLAQSPAGTGLTDSAVAEAFTEVQNSRYDRAVAAVLQGQRSNALVAKNTFLARTFVHHAFPLFGERLIMSLVIKSARTGARIEDLPPPKHALVQSGTNSSYFSQSLWAIGFVGVGIISVKLYFYCNKG